MKGEDRILQKAEEHEKHFISFLQDLVRIPSRTGEEGNAQEFLAKHLKRLGLKVDMWEPDVKEMFRKFPMNAQYPSHWQHDLILPYEDRPTYRDLVKSGKMAVLNYRDRPNVIARYGKKRGGRSLILNGHIDTVTIEPKGEWTRDPFGGEIVEGKLFGRGASDMKGGLVAAMGAIQILIEAGIELKGEVILESVVNEEHAGNGTLACLCKGIRADGAVVTEPSGNNVYTGNHGGIYWGIRIKGNPASPGARWKGKTQFGVSAIEKLPSLIQNLLALEARLRDRKTESNPFSLVIGKVEGGTYETATASDCTMRGVVYFGPDVGKVESVQSLLRRTLKKASRGDPWLRQHPPELYFLHDDDPSRQDRRHPLVSTMARAAREASGIRPLIAGGPFACDMRHLKNQGRIPTVIFGPGGGDTLHRPDEYFPVGDMLPSVKALALMIHRWCNGIT
jgi:acetylornithine deacetylase